MSKYMRLTRNEDVKVAVPVKEGEMPYNRVFMLPQYLRVEVTSEVDGRMQVRARARYRHDWPVEDVEFEVSPHQLFVPKGQLVTIYRDASGVDCSLGGLTSRFRQAVLTDPGLEGPFEETEDTPALRTWTRHLYVSGEAEYTVALPYDAPRGSWAFGGNFVASSDSRVRRALPPYGVVPVHDRDMGMERR